MPAAVLADLLHLALETAVHWMHQAGADWKKDTDERARSVIDARMNRRRNVAGARLRLVRPDERPRLA
jgi:hypothetical protein